MKQQLMPNDSFQRRVLCVCMRVLSGGRIGSGFRV